MVEATDTQICSMRPQMVAAGIGTALVGSAITLLAARVLRQHATAIYAGGFALTCIATPIAAYLARGPAQKKETYLTLLDSELPPEEAAGKLATLRAEETSFGPIVRAFEKATATPERKRAVIHHLPEDVRNEVLSMQNKDWLQTYFTEAEHRSDLLPLVRMWGAKGERSHGPSFLGDALEPLGLLGEAAQELVKNGHHQVYGRLVSSCSIDTVLQVMLDTNKLVPLKWLYGHFWLKVPSKDLLLKVCAIATPEEKEMIAKGLEDNPNATALLADPDVQTALGI